MTDERIFAYLLGELPEEEAERFEEECFAGEDWPDQIRPAEDDLIDAYLRGELAPEQRQHFEQNYLTTEARVKRVAMAAGLLRYINTRGAEEKSAPAREEPTWIKSTLRLFSRNGVALPKSATTFALGPTQSDRSGSGETSGSRSTDFSDPFSQRSNH